jgi:hypothetical protein
MPEGFDRALPATRTRGRATSLPQRYKASSASP